MTALFELVETRLNVNHGTGEGEGPSRIATIDGPIVLQEGGTDGDKDKESRGLAGPMGLDVYVLDEEMKY